MSPKPSTDNPFSSSRIRPGAVEFLFGPGESLDDCLSLLEQKSWWGQVRGPHGSGKSTLLAALLPRLEKAGRRVKSFTLRQGQRRLPITGPASLARDTRTQVVIDGWEQLSWWSRWRLSRLCRQRGWGLLATTHCDLGLPDVYVTRPTAELAQRIAAQLLEGWPDVISSQDVERCFAARPGDLRETLFTLYDVFEERRKWPLIDASP